MKKRIKKNNILLVIAVRQGSKGVKEKNIRPLMGQPLMYYTIKQAIAWNKARHVVVTTDSAKFAKMAAKMGAEVPFIRPKALATDQSGKVPAIKHALLKCEELFAEKFDIVVDLDVTAPIRSIKDLDNCLGIFLKSRPTTLFSVVHAHKNPYFNMVEENSNGKIRLCKKTPAKIGRRQDAPKVYAANASIYFYDRNYLLKSKDPSPVNDNCRFYVMPDLSRHDVDGEVDFKFLEFLVKEGFAKI